MKFNDLLSKTGIWIWKNFPFFILVWILLALPTCLKIGASEEFHFAKVRFLTGLIGAFSFTSILTVISQRSKIAKISIFTICLILAIAELWLFAFFKTRMSAKVIMLIAQTTSVEASEFLKQYLFSPTSLSIILFAASLSIGAYAGLNHLRPTLKRILNNVYAATAFWISNAASITLIIIGTSSLLWFEQISYPSIQQLAWSFNNYLATRGNINELERSTLNASATMSSPGDVPEMIVWVIGESFNKHHSPLYKYPLNTQPNLMNEYKKGNILIFSNAVTASSSTNEVLPQIYSTFIPQKCESWEKSPLFPTLFHKAGYHVALHDNQTTAIISNKWDTSNMWFINSKIIANATLDYRNKTISTVDLDFINQELADSSFTSINPPSLQIFHLMGQHSPAHNRYKLERPPFSHSDYDWRANLNYDQKVTIAEYDNATAYNDLVIATIIKQIEDKDAILIYHSDHGEEIHDYRNQYGRTMEPVTEGIYRNIYQVPLIIYTTPKYREQHPEIYARISNIQQKEVCIADISHFIIDIGGLSSEHFIPSYSFMNSNYTPSRKISIEH